jgi:RNA polymerase sigma factor (sigma-70 family)
MSSPGSITHWLVALKAGEQQAAQPIWERYHAQLLALARGRLRTLRRREADEEDVVQNAFHSFFKGVARGCFPRLDDRDNLWRLLVVITARKALDQIKRERSRTPRTGTILDESRIDPARGEETVLQQIVGTEPTPEFAAQVVEQYQILLDQLGDEGLRQVALLKMEGHTSDEIAAQLACSRRTVARKLDTIRIIWEKEPEP